MPQLLLQNVVNKFVLFYSMLYKSYTNINEQKFSIIELFTLINP